jgi:hypothetical protein
MTTAEQDIAAALVGIDGLDPVAYRPRVIHPGSAWPEWSSALPLTDCTLNETFDVLVVLNDTDQNGMAMDRRRLIPLVCDALRDVGGYIQGSGPVRIALDPGNPAMGGPSGFRVTIQITTQEDE